MVNYRRARIPGASYFFTVTLRDRRSCLLTEHVDALWEAICAVKRQSPFRIDAVVVLPDHLHTLWTLPEGDENYSGRWRAIKVRFTRLLLKRGIGLERNPRGEYALWQRRFWEHVIRDDSDFARHADYIHYNPVKHGLVRRPIDWRWSSVHRYIRLGLLAPDWAAASRDGEFGE